MDINKILNVSNDTFRKTINKDDHGYLFDSQIETAKDIVRNLSRNTTRKNHVILAAKMQSGKTGVCNSVVNIISQTELEKEMMVNKYFFITGMNDCGLKKQTLNRVYQQVISATKDNTYVGKRSKKNLDENKFFVMKNSDLLAYDGIIDNSVIFIDEAHYGSNKKNILTQFLEKHGVDWKDTSAMISRNIYIVSVSATPFDEIVSDTKECKKIVELKPTEEYVGVSEFLNSGLVFDADKNDIEEDGEIFDIIDDNYQRMKNDGVAGVIIIRTRKFDIIKADPTITNRFDIMEMYSAGSNIEYDRLEEAIGQLVYKNHFNLTLQKAHVKGVSVSPLKVKPMLVLIKGAFRAGITLNEAFKDYIYMVYDYSLKADTTAQALLGRMCGYRADKAHIDRTHFYINKKFADMYSDWENDFQNRSKVPCNKMTWKWLPNYYNGADIEFGTKSCGNIAIPLSDDEINTIVNDCKNAKSRVEYMKSKLPSILNRHGVSIDYDYVGEAVLSGKNNYTIKTQQKRFEDFSEDSLVYQFRPYKMKDFIAETGRDVLTHDDLGKKAVFCVLDAEIYPNKVIRGNKRMLIYYVEVGQKKRVPNLRSMYKEHKDTALAV